MGIREGWRRAVPAALVAVSACMTASPPGAFRSWSANPDGPTVILRPEADAVRDFGPIPGLPALDITARISAHVRNIGASRSVDAVFTVDQDAYVLVAHLGADGRIRVMYPAAPGAAARIKAKEQIETQPLTVPEDRAVNGYSQQITRARTVPALQDSYDGRGIGYVFIVASSDPLNTSDFVDGDRWTWLVATDYLTTPDPRIEVRELADQLATPALAGMAGVSFTLEFASAVRTVNGGFDTFGDYAGYDYSSAECSAYGSGYSPFDAGLGWGIAPAYSGAWYRGAVSPFTVNWGLAPLATSWIPGFGGYSPFSSGAYGGSSGCGYAPRYYGSWYGQPTGFGPQTPLLPVRADTTHGRRLIPGDTSRTHTPSHPFYPHRPTTPQSPQATTQQPAPKPRPSGTERPTPPPPPPPPRPSPPPPSAAPPVTTTIKRPGS